MYLYLVRHGQSEGNAKRLFFGHTDYPLTALGREQARQAAKKLSSVSFSRCVTSDLLRAWETAQICVGARALRPEKNAALREQFMGALEGCDWAQSRALYGDMIDAFVHNWYDTVPPTVGAARVHGSARGRLCQRCACLRRRYAAGCAQRLAQSGAQAP